MFKVAILSLMLSVVGTAEAQIPLRVLALGDSITAGGYNELGVWKIGPGYRWDLALMAPWTGYRLEFAGRLKNGPRPTTARHEGHSGKRVDEIHELVRGEVTKLQPNVILLMAGTNDVIQDFHLNSLPRRIVSLINQLQVEAPYAHILIGLPPPTRNPTYNNRIKKLEAYILASRIFDTDNRFSLTSALSPKPRIKVLNFFSNAKLKPADLIDGVHMAPSGNKKLADHWAKGLRCVLRNLDCEFL